MRAGSSWAKEAASSGFAVVWCPDFRLQSVVRRVHRSDSPVVLVDEKQRRSIVLCGNDEAIRQGVEVKMPTVQALARCAALQVERPSEASELATRRTLLEAALSWVPGVEDTEPGWLTLDLSTQDEAEWQASARRLWAYFDALGLDVVIGLGETPELARIAALAARQQGEVCWHLHPTERETQLDRLSLTIAEIGDELKERLNQWGITTLGAFARLQHEAVMARLGQEGGELWLRLRARQTRPLELAPLDHLFEESYDFDYEVNDRDTVLFILNRFVEDLTRRVKQTGRAISGMHLLLSFADGSCYGRRLSLSEASLDEMVLFRVLSGHLDTVEMRSLVESVRLRLIVAEAVASQRTLFGAGLRDQHRFEETLKRLRRIVGAERVGSPRRVDSHEAMACELVALKPELDGSELSDEKPAGPPFVGPVFKRFRMAQRAKVQVGKKRPTYVESPRVTGAVEQAAGPWKSDGHWWHQRRGWQRLEWDVQVRGAGLFRLVQSEGSWVVEGYYD